MRKLLATMSTIALGLVLSPSSWAQDNRDKSEKSGKTEANRGHSGTHTIRGVIAGITTEGEMVIDYKAKKAVEVDAAFLTVVGHHEYADHKDAEHKDKDATAGAKGGHREHVYMVWLSPKTKVCSCSDESGKSVDKKECSLEKLEVGDRVEIMASHREESNASPGANHSESMRMKHGRHRIHSVDAREITIMPAMHDGHSSGGSDAHEKEKDKEKDKK